MQRQHSEIQRERIYKGLEAYLRVSRYRISAADGQPIGFESSTPVKEEPKAIIMAVHGFAQNRFTWHLPTISFANYLANKGFEFASLDLRGCGLSSEYGSLPPAAFEEYILDCEATLQFLLEERAKGKPLFLFGHSMGGALCYAIAPRFSDRIRGIATFCAPYRFRSSMFFRRLPKEYLLKIADFLSSGRGAIPFQMRPLGRSIARRQRLFNNPRFTLPLQSWQGGNMDAESLAERGEAGFDATSGPVVAALLRFAAYDRLCNADQTIFWDEEFEKVNLPFLCCAADNDNRVSPESVIPAYELSGSQDKTLRVFGKPKDAVSFGHVDILLGNPAAEIVWPEVLNWLEAKITL